MKRNLIHLILILFSISTYSQTFSESYYELFRKSWEKEPTKEMIGQIDPKMDSLYRATTGKGFWEMQAEGLKNSTTNNISNYKKVFKLKNLDIDKIDKFIIIEESNRGMNFPPDFSRKGFVLIGTDIFTYYYNPGEENSLKLSNDYFNESNPNHESRKIITDIAKSDKNEQFSVLAKKEMELGIGEPRVEYEIIVYDKKIDEKPLKIIYLHDFVTEIKN
ncbi:hypothetical protein [Psychroserpens sp. S379A]|uniref:hypothetical protein n=1 Tax=Psychroserpens sp. S379A TaxID=3415137 RepID=UPI003C7DC86D